MLRWHSVTIRISNVFDSQDAGTSTHRSRMHLYVPGGLN